MTYKVVYQMRLAGRRTIGSQKFIQPGNPVEGGADCVRLKTVMTHEISGRPIPNFMPCGENRS